MSLKQQYEKCLQEKADTEAKLESEQRTLKQKENNLKQIDQKINVRLSISEFHFLDYSVHYTCFLLFTLFYCTKKIRM